jgi:plastocyanin
MRRTYRRLTLSLAPALLVLALPLIAACGDDDDDDDTASPGSTQAATSASGSGSGGAQSIKVSAADFEFAPDEFKLKVSTGGGAAGSVNVALKNDGKAPHSFSLYKDEGFKDLVPGSEIKSTPAGGSGSSVFVAPAEKTDYYFRCEIHPTQMKGEIEFE